MNRKQISDDETLQIIDQAGGWRLAAAATDPDAGSGLISKSDLLLPSRKLAAWPATGLGETESGGD